MAHQVVNNVRIAGIVTCVPKKVEENIGLSFFQRG